MFSRGNAVERHRIGSLDCRGEVIVDLFAGIGYFTLPYLVKAKAQFVHACEWNHDAVEALRENLKLNHVEDRCLIHEGDNRLVHPKNVADRVNLGLIPTSSGSWAAACSALRSSGGILYVHENVTCRTKGFPENSNSDCSSCKALCERFWALNSDRVFKTDQGLSGPIFELSSFNSELVAGDIENGILWKYAEVFELSIHLTHALLNTLEQTRGSKWKVSVKKIFKIKQYAPRIFHYVFEVHCGPL